MFELSDALTLEELENNKDKLYNKLIPIEKILKKYPSLIIENKEIGQFLNGVRQNIQLEDGIYRIYTEETKFLGTGEVKGNKLKRDVII